MVNTSRFDSVSLIPMCRYPDGSGGNRVQTAPSTASCSGGQEPLSPLASPSAAATAEEDGADALPAEADGVALDAEEFAVDLVEAAVVPTMSAAVAGVGGERVIGGSAGDRAAISENQRWMLALPPPNARATAAELELDA